MHVWLPALTGRKTKPPIDADDGSWSQCIVLKDEIKGRVKIAVGNRTFIVEARFLRTSRCKQCNTWRTLENDREHMGYCSLTCREAMDVRRGFS